MECRDCGRALDRDARFCPGCGVVVVSACAECGAELEADARFCKRCGHAVATTPQPARTPATSAPRAASVRERKVATMLFADIADFTQLAEQHDAEVVSTASESVRLAGQRSCHRLGPEYDLCQGWSSAGRCEPERGGDGSSSGPAGGRGSRSGWPAASDERLRARSCPASGGAARTG